MLYLLSSWLFWLLVCYGLGNSAYFLLRSVMPNTKHDELNFYQKTWFGFAILTTILVTINIFSPINNISRIIVIILAIPSFLAAFATALRHNYSRNDLSFMMGAAVIGGIVSLIVSAVCALHPIKVYDTGLYHLNMVQWIKDYPVVPGLGNLHGRLAFNSSFHVFAAATDFWIWEGLSARIAAGFLVSLSSTYWLWNIFLGKFNVLPSVFLFLTLGFFHRNDPRNRAPRAIYGHCNCRCQPCSFL